MSAWRCPLRCITPKRYSRGVIGSNPHATRLIRKASASPARPPEPFPPECPPISGRADANQVGRAGAFGALARSSLGLRGSVDAGAAASLTGASSKETTNNVRVSKPSDSSVPFVALVFPIPTSATANLGKVIYKLDAEPHPDQFDGGE
jgi:hypothetical protein